MKRETLMGCLAIAASASAAPTLQGAEVLFALPNKTDVHVAVELARDKNEQSRGLMYRRSLAPGSGMLFLFPVAEPHQFWMRNTYVSLDMIFLDADRKVVFVEERAEPLNDKPRGPKEPTQYVVEVPGGWARSHGIEPGIAARFVGVPTSP